MRAISRHTTAREGFRYVCYRARNWDLLLDWASGKPVTRTAILIYQIEAQSERGFSRIAFQALQQNGSHSASRRAKDPLRRVASKRLNCCRTAFQEDPFRTATQLRFPMLTLRDTNFHRCPNRLGLASKYETASLPSGQIVTSGHEE